LELGEEVQRIKSWSSYLKVFQNLNGIMGHTVVILLMQEGGISMEMLFNKTSGTYCLIFLLPELFVQNCYRSLNVLGDQIEDDEANETRSSHWKTRNTQGVVIGKSRTKLLRQRFRRSWVDNLDVHDSVHHSANHIEITNKMQPCTRIYYSNVLLIAQHVSSDRPLIIRST
jgi:hypothetical protein